MIVDVIIRKYEGKDLRAMTDIWNEIVEDGIAFPQTDFLTEAGGRSFFAEQTYTAVAQDSESGEIYGLYILHPNNIGRCGHICNASYAVRRDRRGLNIGEKLVEDSIAKGKAQGFKIMQFNAVVETNAVARHIYEKLGFRLLGTIPGGFFMKGGYYENICVYYYVLNE